MRGLLIALFLSPLLAASAAAQSAGEPLASALKQALAEESAANARTASLEQVASRAQNAADRVRAEQAAASQAIEAAEARISAADVQLRIASAYVTAHRQQLATEQRPVSLLVAGLATMVRRPPLLVLADARGTDELVKVRLLLDATLPLIRKRTLRISAELSNGERLERASIADRSELARSRTELEARRQRYAALERRAVQQALASTGQALGASDFAIAAGENVERLRAQESGSQSIRRVADVLAHDQPAPASPFKPDGPGSTLPFDYGLPAAAAVTEGLGAISDSGVLARGITLATVRGSPIVAPADGTIRFAGPYRDYDAVLIVDHGDGFLSVIVNAATVLHAGDRVHRGDPIGRALGPLQVELSHNGRRISPALIAGSSQNLSKAIKGR